MTHNCNDQIKPLQCASCLKAFEDEDLFDDGMGSNICRECRRKECSQCEEGDCPNCCEECAAQKAEADRP